MSVNSFDVRPNQLDRPASWRWLRACDLHTLDDLASTQTDNEMTLRALSYVRLLGSTHCPIKLVKKALVAYPDLHAAHHVFDHGGEVRSELEARLLAGQSSVEIAAKLSLDLATSETYHAVFFDVRGRITARDWIMSCVIGSGHSCGFGDDIAGIWKAVAYAGGPLVLEAVIAVTSKRPRRSYYRRDLLEKAKRLVNVLKATSNLSLLSTLDFGGKVSRRTTTQAKMPGRVRTARYDAMMEDCEGAYRSAKASVKAILHRPNQGSKPRSGKKSLALRR